MSATPDSTLVNPEQLITDLQRQLDEREAELAEAREQQTATAEVLRVINSSPGDLAPVFDRIIEQAVRLCGAAFGALFLAQDEYFRAVAMRGGTEAWHERMRTVGFRGSETPVSQPLVAGAAFVHIVNLAEIDHP